MQETLKFLKIKITKKHLKEVHRMILCFFMLILSFALLSCTPQNTNEVIIYTSVDQIYSEPIFSAFEEKTGIKVKALYDVEAQKTTGLTARLEAEKNNPQADVFWNGEFTKTISLMEKDIITEYISFGGRARVLLVNTNKIKKEDYPESIFDLTSERYDSSTIAIARPLFGTTFTHACAIYAELGDSKGKAFFEAIQSKDIRVVEGNSVVRDLVVAGEMVMGLTDTDDAYDAIKKGKTVEIVFLDQGEGAMGTLIAPNTVGKVKGSKNATNGNAFVEFITSDATALLLYESGWIDFVENEALIVNPRFEFSKVKAMDLKLEEICAQQNLVVEDLTKLFMD